MGAIRLKSARMEPLAEVFNRHRPRLWGIAYRMLGARADAQDVLQDAYLRWHQARPDDVRNSEAWLVTVVTRLCIDRLRARHAERETYVGPWLPQPVAGTELPAPQHSAEVASDVSMAFLVLLERLAPDERAAFLLHEVFEIDYREIAQMLGRSEPACRQLVHRARLRVREGRPRFSVSRETHRRLLERFVPAMQSGDRDALMALLAEDARYVSDGGGKVPAASRPLQGGKRVARLLHAIARRVGDRASYRIVDINGEPGVVRYLGGKLDAAITFLSDGRRLLEIYYVRNPDKLDGIKVE
jgi:RNA polymerase sigma-70 factor (ECF subfamily)